MAGTMNETGCSRQLRASGYVLHRGVLPIAECEELALESERLLKSPLVSRSNLRTELAAESDGWHVSKYDPVIDVSEVYRALASDARIVSRVECALGESSALFKDKLIYKYPGHQGFGPHQDAAWYGPFNVDVVAALLSIDRADDLNGALEVAPSSKDLSNPVPSGEVRDLRAGEVPGEDEWELVSMDPGDFLIFTSCLPHRSGPNRGHSPRRALYLSYAARRHGCLYSDYYGYRADLLREGMGPTMGNFGVAADLRATATFLPPVGPPPLHDASDQMHSCESCTTGHDLPTIRLPARVQLSNGDT